MPVVGWAELSNGQTTTGNDLDENNQPVTESIFGQNMTISPITVLSNQNGRFRFGNSHIMIGDETATYLSADITGITADTNAPLTNQFYGMLSNVQLGDSSLGSSVLQDWRDALANGEALQFNLDGSAVGGSSNFTSAYSDSSIIGVNVIPEPSAVVPILLGASALMLRRPRRC